MILECLKNVSQVKLAQHTYSNMFGTFLCNNSRERTELNVSSRTFSVWSFLQSPQYLNHLYSSHEQVSFLFIKRFRWVRSFKLFRVELGMIVLIIDESILNADFDTCDRFLIPSTSVWFLSDPVNCCKLSWNQIRSTVSVLPVI